MMVIINELKARVRNPWQPLLMYVSKSRSHHQYFLTLFPTVFSLHFFLLCSISSHLFCPFPVLSLPFHFISIRVNPMCLDCFMHLVSWNLGWSLYFTGFMRWGDETGTAHKGSLVHDHKSADWQLMGLMKGEKNSPELSTGLEWGLWIGDDFTFLKTIDRRMNGLETYFPLSGRKEIYYCLILLFKFCPKKFQEPL